MGGSIWDPVSVETPSEEELRENEELARFLDSVEPLASAENLKLRKQVLDELQSASSRFVHELAVQQGFAEEIVRVAGCRLFAFGSFKLGVVSDASDMDLVLVCAKHVSREQFFAQFPRELGELGAETVQVVADAQTPVINFRLRGIPVDLLFARVNQTAVDPRDFSLQDDALLKNLDDKTVRSLNGTRVAEQLLGAVEAAGAAAGAAALEGFRLALRFVKYHAKQRGLYGNAIGMLGGISYAILLARVVQMYPRAPGLTLVRKFFLIYPRWNWKQPVYLGPIEFKTSEVGFGSLKVWNPRQYLADKAHVMPVITPAFPAMCSTYNVTNSAKALLLGEWRRAGALLGPSGSAGGSSGGGGGVERALEQATEKPEFFWSFPVYVSLEIAGGEEQSVASFRGFVESRVKIFVKLLEQTQGVQSVRVWPDAVLGNFYIGLAVPPNAPVTVDLRPAVAAFLDKTREGEAAANGAGHVSLAVAFYRQKNLPEALTGRKPAQTSAAAAAAASALATEFKELQEDDATTAVPVAKRRKLDLSIQI